MMQLKLNFIFYYKPNILFKNDDSNSLYKRITDISTKESNNQPHSVCFYF